LEGRLSFVVFLWEGQTAPLIVPFADYEEVFHDTTPARDRQYKTQIYISEEGTELYIARAGRFNVDAHIGWESMERAVRARRADIPDLTHPQIQTLLGAIGALKNFDVWIPLADREALDWSMARRFSCVRALPYERTTCALLDAVDAMWLRRGSNELVALYEVEHSTPIYSGLLRLNDIRLTLTYEPRLAIVSNDVRRSVFMKQLRRPTFQRSGLTEKCTFLEYREVFEWYRRAKGD